MAQLGCLSYKCFTQGNETFVEDLEKLKTYISLLSANDLNLNSETITEAFSSTSSPVIFIPVCKNEVFSIRIFAIRSGSEIPLHDHPEMYGLCKVLYGSIKLKSFTQTGVNPINDRSGKLKCVRNCEDKLVSSGDDCCLVTPSTGNLHEITAVGGMAVFLDVLAPPYSYGERYTPCNYYRIVEESCDNPAEKYLQLMDTPSGYRCTRMEYNGPIIH